jgi:S1-C subfamily serine protease
MNKRPCFPRQYSRHHRFAAMVCLAACLAGASAAPPDDAQAPARSADAATTETKGDTIEKSVVKIFATVRYPDHFKPWNKQSPAELVGSGVVIEGKRILSAAHVVLYASQVQIEANEAGDKITATVAGISPETDLAVLKLDDETFFDSHPPLARARQLPDIKDAVMVYGFPTGGTSMSITKGIVSRIEFSRFNYGASGLRIQVDAAINPGNSGGPAVVGDKMVGLAFAHLSRAENISYIIPCEDIELFLKKMVDGKYHGRPSVNFRAQALQNSALRSFLKVDKAVHGVVVQAVGAVPADDPLRKWDIITRIGDTEIDDEAMIKLPGGLRVAFTYLIEQLATNGTVPMTVLRSGERLQLQIPVLTSPEFVVPFLKGSYPSYFVYGPLVFCDASQDLLADLIYGRAAAFWTGRLLDQANPVLRECDEFADSEGKRLVVVTSFFPHKLSRGYDDPTAEVVKTINGAPIRNLGQLVQVLRDCKDEFITVDFDGHFTDTLIFSRAEMLANTDDILTDNSVRSQGSPDMMAIWNAKKN